MKQPFLVISVILVGIGTLVFADNTTKKQTAEHFQRISQAAKTTKKQASENFQRISQMGEMSDEERMTLLGQIDKERSDIQGNLINQLGNSRSKEVKFAAAFLLGFYRMEKSVYALSRHITLENESLYDSSRLPLWDRYPTVEALIRIGKPAIREMLRNIETSDDRKVRELSARVIRYVEGPEIGRIVVQKAMDKQSDPERKDRLAVALKYLKNESKEATQEKPVAVTAKPPVEKAPFWALPSLLIGAVAGMALFYLIGLLKKRQTRTN